MVYNALYIYIGAYTTCSCLQLHNMLWRNLWVDQNDRSLLRHWNMMVRVTVHQWGNFSGELIQILYDFMLIRLTWIFDIAYAQMEHSCV